MHTRVTPSPVSSLLVQRCTNCELYSSLLVWNKSIYVQIYFEIILIYNEFDKVFSPHPEKRKEEERIGIPCPRLQPQCSWDIHSRGFACIGILASKNVSLTFWENYKKQHKQASLNCVSARESKPAKANDQASAYVDWCEYSYTKTFL